MVVRLCEIIALIDIEKSENEGKYGSPPFLTKMKMQERGGECEREREGRKKKG